VAVADDGGAVAPLVAVVNHGHNDVVDDHHLVPGYKQSPDLWGEGALAEGQGHGPASVDHKVKPAVLLGHGVALGVNVGVGHPHAH